MIGFLDKTNSDCGINEYIDSSSNFCYTSLIDSNIHCFTSVPQFEYGYTMLNNTCVNYSLVSSVQLSFFDYQFLMGLSAILVSFSIVFFTSFSAILNGRK